MATSISQVTEYQKLTDREHVYETLRSGQSFLFYGPGGVGKTHEMKHIYERHIRAGGNPIICALSNHTAQSLHVNALGIYQAFGFIVGNGGHPISRLHQVCQSLRRCNKKYRNTDQQWDRREPSDADYAQKKYAYTTLREQWGKGCLKRIASSTDYQLLAGIAADESSKLGPIFKRLRDCDLLFIEEVFMVGEKLFHAMDITMRLCKDKPDEIFGGCPLLLCGDVMQNVPIGDQFLFHSPIWEKLALHVKMFRTYYRFADPEWIGILSRIRVGKHTEADIQVLQGRMESHIARTSHVELCPTRDQASHHNDKMFNNLPPYHTKFNVKAHDRYYRVSWKVKETQQIKEIHEVFDTESINIAKRLFKHNASMVLPETLRVAEGARVISVWNDHKKKLYNGTIGDITEVECAGDIVHAVWVSLLHPVAHKPDDCYFKEADLRVGETIHYIECEDSFSSGNNIIDSVKFLNPFMKRKHEDSPMERKLKILSVDAKSVITQDIVKVVPVKISVESSGWLLERYTLPLELAWALTIHKLQGISTATATVTIKGTMSPGQAYVALSRCASLEGLVLKEPFHPGCIVASQEALKFDLNMTRQLEVASPVVPSSSTQDTDPSQTHD